MLLIVITSVWLRLEYSQQIDEIGCYKKFGSLLTLHDRHHFSLKDRVISEIVRAKEAIGIIVKFHLKDHVLFFRIVELRSAFETTNSDQHTCNGSTDRKWWH